MVSRNELKRQLAQLGVRPSRKLGQNFLVDANLLEMILREAGPAPDERVLEVGAGTGILTARLLAAGCRVTAVELDHRLAAYLRRRFETDERLELLEGDACKLDLGTIMGTGDWRCISNLPYGAGSIVLAHLSELENPPVDALVLMQREVAGRICAAAGSREYGMLSVRVGLAFSPRLVRSVAPTVFHPQPQVASALVRLRRREPAFPAARRQAAAEIARRGFGQRRKQFLNLLAPTFPRTALVEAFERLGIAPDARAEQLPVIAFVRLAGCLAGD